MLFNPYDQEKFKKFIIMFKSFTAPFVHLSIIPYIFIIENLMFLLRSKT